MYLNKQLVTISVSLCLFSCSSLVENTRKSLLGDSEPRKKSSTTKEVKWVSKAQYDDLMNKYKNLNDRYDQLKMQNVSQGGQLDQITNQDDSAETVDVFGKNGLVNSKPIAAKPIKKAVTNSTSIEQDLSYYKKALRFKNSGNLEESLKMFQFLENSKTKQIGVRAKKHIGDIYFAKGQFDLALQVYEDVIRKNAFSGSTIKALGKASVCAGNLGLMDKKAQYESLLQDVFGMQV